MFAKYVPYAAVIIVIAGCTYIYQWWKRHHRRIKAYNKGLEQNLFRQNYEVVMYREGFIFCTLFTKHHILRIAEKEKVVLTHQDLLQIIAAIKRDFTIEEGINAYRIRGYILAHVNEKKSMPRPKGWDSTDIG